MTGWELAIVSALYLRVAWRYHEMGDPGMVIAFVAYAAANAGFILSITQRARK